MQTYNSTNTVKTKRPLPSSEFIILTVRPSQELEMNDIKISYPFVNVSFQPQTIPGIGNLCRCINITLFRYRTNYFKVIKISNYFVFVSQLRLLRCATRSFIGCTQEIVEVGCETCIHKTWCAYWTKIL